jgi:hypothetical protein
MGLHMLLTAFLIIVRDWIRATTAKTTAVGVRALILAEILSTIFIEWLVITNQLVHDEYTY